MKNITGLLVLLISLFLFSCTDCDCSDTGECIDNMCVCDEFYEGETCEDEIRAKYYGTYNGAFNCIAFGSNAFNITIAAGPELNQIVMIDPTTDLLVDTITLDGNSGPLSPRTETNSGVTFEFTGTITFNSASDFDFIQNVTTFGNTEVCLANFVKQ